MQIKVPNNRYSLAESLLQLFGGVCPLIVKLLFEKIYEVKYNYFWAYLGTTFNPNPDKAIASWIMALIFAGAYVTCIKDKRGTLFGLLINISLMPSLSIYWMKDQPEEAFFLIIVYWMIWWICTYISCKLYSRESLRIISENDKTDSFIPDNQNIILVAVYLWTAITTLYLSFRYGGLRLFIDLNDVYTYRLSNIGMSSIENYIFAWNTNACIPLLMGIHYLQKRRILFLSDILLMLLSYGIFGNKSMLMTIPLVFGVIILHKLGLTDQTCNMVGVFVIAYITASFIVPSQMFVALGDRILNGPAAGHFNYYDFFSNDGNPLLYLRESIFRLFADSPYEELTSQIIGSSSKYYSGAYNNMNNGLFSIAYANFGIAGVIIQPILIVTTYTLIMRQIASYDKIIQYILTILYALFLISTSYFSWLLTGGVIIEVCILLAIRHFDYIRVVLIKNMISAS